MNDHTAIPRPTGAGLAALRALRQCRLPIDDSPPATPDAVRAVERLIKGEMIGWHGLPDRDQPGTYALASVEIATVAGALRWTAPDADWAPTAGLDLGPDVGWLEVLRC